MTDFFLIREIEARRQALRLAARELFSGAGVSQPTWNRALRGADISTGALRKLTEELVQQERAELTRLVSLHPELAAELVAAKQEEAA